MERRIDGIPCDFERTMRILQNGLIATDEENGIHCNQNIISDEPVSSWFDRNKREDRDYTKF